MQGKVTLKDSAAMEAYAGIDVCKRWLDIAIHAYGPFSAALPHGALLERSCERFENTGKGLKKLIRWLSSHHVALIVMEATGKLHRKAHKTLHEAGFAVAIVNPLRARLFAEAVGQLAKTDRIDAACLALMAATVKPSTVVPKPELMENLQELLRARQALVDERTAFLNRIAACTCCFLKRELARQRTSLAAGIVRIEKEILRLLKTDPSLERRYRIVLSIPGVGPVAAAALATGLGELGTCSAKQAAMLAGLAPLACESGESKGARHIRGGRAGVRRSLYMAAVSAIKHNKPLKAFYGRLTGAGKLPKIALTAVMRKLVVIANTLITQDRFWQGEPPQHA